MKALFQGLAPRLLLIEDDATARLVFHRWLHAEGYEVDQARSLAEGLERMGAQRPDGVFLDLGLPDADGVGALDAIRRRAPTMPVVVISAETEVEVVVTAMQKGAFGYLAKPVSRDRLLEAAERAAIRGRMETTIESGEHTGAARLVGGSPLIEELRGRIRRAASSDAAVLVYGESGSGQDRVARAIHEESARRAGPFVALSCAATPEPMLAVRLLGREEPGGAPPARGDLELASGGTLFLDDVAELPPSLQATLLRCLQERSFRRGGGSSDVAADFRLVTASPRRLLDEVAAGRFREDLHFRLSVLELRLPPLRERGEDVLLLCQALLKDLFPEGALPLSPDAEQLLLGYSWPGNLFELKNALHHAVVMRSGDILTAADFPERIQRPPSSRSGRRLAGSRSGAEALDGRLAEVERHAIEKAIAACGGSVTEAAKRLGIGRATLYRRLKQWGITTDGRGSKSSRE